MKYDMLLHREVSVPRKLLLSAGILAEPSSLQVYLIFTTVTFRVLQNSWTTIKNNPGASAFSVFLVPGAASSVCLHILPYSPELYVDLQWSISLLLFCSELENTSFRCKMRSDEYSKNSFFLFVINSMYLPALHLWGWW